MRIDWLLIFGALVLVVASYVIDPATDLGVSNTMVDIYAHHADVWSEAERKAYETAHVLRMLAALLCGVGIGNSSLWCGGKAPSGRAKHTQH
jgi:hypothetical protein